MRNIIFTMLLIPIFSSSQDIENGCLEANSQAEITGDDLILKYSLTAENSNNEQATFWKKEY